MCPIVFPTTKSVHNMCTNCLCGQQRSFLLCSSSAEEWPSHSWSTQGPRQQKRGRKLSLDSRSTQDSKHGDFTYLSHPKFHLYIKPFSGFCQFLFVIVILDLLPILGLISKNSNLLCVSSSGFVWFQLFFSYFKDLVGREVTVELKNDLAIRGTLHSVDQYLNIKLENTMVVDQDKYPHMVTLSFAFIILGFWYRSVFFFFLWVWFWELVVSGNCVPKIDVFSE